MLLRPVLSALALSTAVATAAAAEDVDWLLAAHDPAASSYKATLTKGEGGALELSNGLVSRSFITEPNFATVDLRRLDTLYSGGGSFFRALPRGDGAAVTRLRAQEHEGLLGRQRHRHHVRPALLRDLARLYDRGHRRPGALRPAHERLVPPDGQRQHSVPFQELQHGADQQLPSPLRLDDRRLQLTQQAPVAAARRAA
jgi:hypothetical protein